MTYRPRYENCQHWAIYIEEDGEQSILEVVGEYPRFER
jgi:hypothetical protein